MTWTARGGADHAAGFDVARSGETAIRAALDWIAASATGHLDAPNKAFGPMYTCLSRDYLREPGFALFGRILRDCILDHWPIAPGETLIGEVVAERRLHSVVTAAQEAGVGVEVIEHFLIEAGAVPDEDDRPSSRRVFEARPYASCWRRSLRSSAREPCARRWARRRPNWRRWRRSAC